MNRLLMETLAAGDPFDVHAGIVELITDELRHVALCASVVRALGMQPRLPETLDVKQPDTFLRMPPSQRALSIAISMLIVNETLSVGYIQDLAQRCQGPMIKEVLAATLADESEHDAFGVQYVKQALAQSPAALLPQWRAVASQSYRAQRSWAEGVIAGIPEDKRSLDAFDDNDVIALGLFSQQRQALLFQRNLPTVSIFRNPNIPTASPMSTLPTPPPPSASRTNPAGSKSGSRPGTASTGLSSSGANNSPTPVPEPSRTSPR
jgi:hypothetical protein